MSLCASPEKTSRPAFAAPPASRASWIGCMKWESLNIPVKAYAAVVTSPSGLLCQVHAGCGRRIEYRKWCPKHGHISSADVGKGYVYDSDRVVELNDDDLGALGPPDDKTLHLERTIVPAQLDLVLLAGRSMFLTAATPAATGHFELVRRAIQQSGRWFLGRVILSGRHQLVVIRPTEDRLVLHTLHDPSQCRSVTPVDRCRQDIDAREVNRLTKTFSRKNHRIRWDDYVDNTDAEMAAWVSAKLRPTRHDAVRLRPNNHRASSRSSRQDPALRRQRAA